MQRPPLQSGSSVTADFGTESGLSRQRAPLFAVLPYAALDGELAEHGDARCFTLQKSWQVPGVLHICHNVCHDVTDSMEHFEEFKAHMCALAAVLSDKILRQGTQALLFSSGPASVHYAKFAAFGERILDHRWQSVSIFLREFEPLEQPLREYWNLEAMNRRGRGSDGQSAKRLHAFDAAMTCQELWPYLQMLRALFQVVDAISEWAQACACHWQRRVERVLSQACPLRGRRAPELACGEISSFLDELKNEFSGAWLASPQCTADWSQALQRMQFLLELKFGFWTTLPHALAGLCHPCDDKARLCARNVLAQWQCLKESGSECLHASRFSLCRKLLDAGELRELTLRFMRGELSRTDADMAEWRKALAPVSFIPIVERSVEGRHAQIHRIVARAPNKSGALLSLSLRTPLLLNPLQCDSSRLGADAGVLSKVATILAQCRDAKWLLKHLRQRRPPFPWQTKLCTGAAKPSFGTLKTCFP